MKALPILMMPRELWVFVKVGGLWKETLVCKEREWPDVGTTPEIWKKNCYKYTSSIHKNFAFADALK